MTATAVYALAFLPAVLWGFSPVLSKRGMAGGGSSLQASLVVVTLDSAVYWTGVLVLVGPAGVLALPAAAFGVIAAAGLVGTALGRLATFTGVDRVGASVNSAGISTRPLFATLLAAAWLGEAVTPTTAVGVAVLVVGLVVLTLSKGGDITGWRPRDLLFPLSAALAFGVGNVVRRFGLTAYPDTTLFAAVAVNETTALVALGAYAVFRDRRDVLAAPRETYGYFAASGTLTAVALLSLFAALRLGRVAVVDPITATAPLFTTVFAAVLLRDLERVTTGVVAGAALVVLGAALVVTDARLVAIALL